MNLKQAKELVHGRLSDKRYEHTLNVRKMAVKLAKRYGVDEDKAALAALLHDAAKEISKAEMAIACHPAGKPGMSKLDKIVYLADMSSKERDWPGVNKLRKLELKDLDLAMLAALRQTNDFVLSQGKPLDPMSKAAYEDILAHCGKKETDGGAA